MTADPQVNPAAHEYCDQCVADGLDLPTIPPGQKFIVVTKGDLDKPKAQIKLCMKHAQAFAVKLTSPKTPEPQAPEIPVAVDSGVRGSWWRDEAPIPLGVLLAIAAFGVALGFIIAHIHR